MRAPKQARRLDFACLVLAACSADEGTVAPARRGTHPDILFVSLDSVRADALTFDDPEATPRLYDLARGGTVFTEAFAGSSWTLPSHVQLFTGQPPLLHGVHDDDRRIDPRTPTLPEVLARAGYFGVGVWSGWYLAGAYGFERGFDRYQSALAPDAEADRALAEALRSGGAAAYWAQSLRASRSEHEVTSTRVVELARRAIEDAPEDRPLFLFTHFFDPHYDFVPPPPFDRLFDPDYEGTIDGRDYWRNPAIYDPRTKPHRRIGDRDLDHIRALYRGEIAWTDRAIGEIVDLLRAHGRLEDTLIVVTADHGEEFFEHGNRGHRQTLYDEVLRVPLLVVPPAGVPVSGRPPMVDALVELSDVMPTVLDFAGLESPPAVWGRSLRPLMTGGTRVEWPIVASLAMTRGGPGAPGGASQELMLECWRSSSSKLIRRVLLERDGGRTVEAVEWFDLAEDPLERDGAGERERVRVGWDGLEAVLEALRRFYRQLPHSEAAERATGAREVFAGELAGLGYLDSTDANPPRSERTLAPPPPTPLPAELHPPR